jgi:hypothetical protein
MILTRDGGIRVIGHRRTQAFLLTQWRRPLSLTWPRSESAPLPFDRRYFSFQTYDPKTLDPVNSLKVGIDTSITA